MNYKHYSTDEYDGRFEKAKADGLHWLPWVGKHYDETRILIIGASTHKDGECDWTNDPKWGMQEKCQPYTGGRGKQPRCPGI